MPEQTERRLGAVLLSALSIACDQRDLDVARLVYQALQLVMTRRTGADEVEKRAQMADDLQAVYDRYVALERGQR